MNILSFDIEDWFGYKVANLEDEHVWLPRINGYLDAILDLLDERKIKASFFCLGEVAKSNRDVIKKIANRGHHIGCHSYGHKFWNDANYQVVEEDTKRAICTIEDLICDKVDAYRAPAFSITENNTWIFEILFKYGIKYDCSIFPANRSFGGFPTFPSREPSIVRYGDCIIKEFPIPVVQIMGRNIAYSGGGYFRFFPYYITSSIINNSSYVMTYFHVKDFDREQVKKIASFNGENGFSRYFKNYYGLKSCFSKFKRLLNEFEFTSVRDADKLIKWNNECVINL